MGLVDRFERKLESTVGDAFARVFGGSIVPQEVEAMLRREADTGAREIPGGRILAPNDYVITLSVPDYRKVSADPDLTSTTFAKYLEGYIHDQGWQTYGDVVVRFEQSPNLHTGQFRARGAVNPDSTTGEPAPPPRELSSNAEPGVPPMTDNPSYRGGQGQGRPADEYYDERYGRPDDRRQRSARQGRYPPQGGYPPQGEPPAYPPRGRATRAGRLPGPGRLPRPGLPASVLRAAPARGYGPPQAAATRPGYGQRPAAATARRPGGPATAPRARAYDYGLQPAPGRPDEGGYRAAPGRRPLPGPGRLPRAGRLSGSGRLRRAAYGRQEYAQPDYGRYGEARHRRVPDMPTTATATSYGELRPGGYGARGYGQGDYPSAASPSRCSSTTAAAAPTSYARAPT